VPKTLYDDDSLHFDASSVGFVPWHLLKNVENRSIEKSAKYRHQQSSGDREEREKLSEEFDLKYILAIMNSTFARDWLKPRRRSKFHVYPDDWKELPIAPISQSKQSAVVKLVNGILSEFEKHGAALPEESAVRVAALEKEINERVAALYGL
jgi:hypothetical protein